MSTWQYNGYILKSLRDGAIEAEVLLACQRVLLGVVGVHFHLAVNPQVVRGLLRAG